MILSRLASAVLDRRVSSEELVRMSLDRIGVLDGPINSVIRLRAEEALEEARAFDADRTRPHPLPLAGIPLLVKDNEDCAGMPTTFGSLLRADAAPAERDCEVVGRLRAAGAIVVGKTNLPEFAFEGFTSNLLFGETRNPWAPEWTPGGSSGGSGAALMMGLAPLATGTDGGGSIRIPAAFCGFPGLKPTNGIIGRDPVPSWIDLSTKGPMATSIADLRLLLDVMRGPAAGDPTALPEWTAKDPPPLPRRILAGPRMSDWGPLPDGIRASFEAALAGLERATGLPIEPIEAPLPTLADEDWFTLCSVDELIWIGRDVLASREAELSSPLRAALELGSRVSLDAYVVARRRRFEFVKILDGLLGEDAVLATPTMCVEGFSADGRAPGATEPGTASDAYNTLAQNMTGHPAISLPAGLSANGVPFGLQLTGPRFADDMLLALGAAFEAASPWPLAAPGYEPFAI